MNRGDNLERNCTWHLHLDILRIIQHGRPPCISPSLPSNVSLLSLPLPSDVHVCVPFWRAITC
jgi:hypothetical protein